jgi:NAD-dependent SIR2 family protein deacetylase
MKTVFILGAGASALAGVPMMAEFLDRAERLFREQNDSAAQDVFRAITELQGVYAKSYLDLDNIEAVFGAIEMAQLIGKLADRSPESIATLRGNLINMIVRTVEMTTHFPVREGQIQTAKPYGPFAKMIAELINPQSGKRMDVSFLTFNYDLALDQALFWSVIPTDYGLGEKLKSNHLPLLKLHGSINWGICEKCKAIVAFELGEVPMSIRSDATKFTYNIGTRIGLKKHCGEPLKGPPVLVPPTWNKNDYHSGLQRVWAQAAKELGQADNIIIIGYSLPETDSFFRYLFALGSTSDTRLKRLWVVNPDYTGEVGARFETMVGRGIRGRLKMLKSDQGMFENAIKVIHNELRSELD